MPNVYLSIYWCESDLITFIFILYTQSHYLLAFRYKGSRQPTWLFSFLLSEHAPSQKKEKNILGPGEEGALSDAQDSY